MASELWRGATGSGQQSLASGSSQAAIRTAIANSTEASNAIGAAFQAELGRAATSSDLATWQQNLANGSTLASLQSALTNSTDGYRAIDAIYQAVLGRDATSAGMHPSHRHLEGQPLP